jgi:hypothetical protein
MRGIKIWAGPNQIETYSLGTLSSNVQTDYTYLMTNGCEAKANKSNR